MWCLSDINFSLSLSLTVTHTLIMHFLNIVEPVYSGHHVSQPPPYYSHLVQALQVAKTQYITHLFKAYCSCLAHR